MYFETMAFSIFLLIKSVTLCYFTLHDTTVQKRGDQDRFYLPSFLTAS